MERLTDKVTELSSPDCPIDQAALVYFDIETTGLHPERGAEVTEAAIIDGGGVRWSWRQRRDDPFGEVLPELVAELTAGVVVGHNLSFDFSFLAYEASRRQLDGPEVRYVDTLGLARQALSSLPDHRLSSLVEHFELEFEGRLHTAEVDARLTRKLLWRLVKVEHLETLSDAGLQRLVWSTT